MGKVADPGFGLLYGEVLYYLRIAFLDSVTDMRINNTNTFSD
jgi:hypothetical protein